LQGGKYSLHLLLGGIERSGIIDHEIGGFNFFFVRDLRGHAARYLGAGSIFGNSYARGVTMNSLAGIAGHDDQMVETAGAATFQNQGGFDNGDRARIAPANFFHPLVFVRDHGRMDNPVEFLDSRGQATRCAERGCGQPGAVHGSVGIQDFTAKMADYFLIDWPAGQHEFVSDCIGLDEMCSEFHENSADSRLAACDAAGEAEF
jgi:hypothetical protein